MFRLCKQKGKNAEKLFEREWKVRHRCTRARIWSTRRYAFTRLNVITRPGLNYAIRAPTFVLQLQIRSDGLSTADSGDDSAIQSFNFDWQMNYFAAVTRTKRHRHPAWLRPNAINRFVLLPATRNDRVVHSATLCATLFTTQLVVETPTRQSARIYSEKRAGAKIVAGKRKMKRESRERTITFFPLQCLRAVKPKSPDHQKTDNVSEPSIC